MVETLLEQDYPQTLLVLGNGFDKNCKLPSSYYEFLESNLQEKVNYNQTKLENNGYSSIFEYCIQELIDYLKSVNFFHGLAKHNFIVPDLNPWYIIFLYKRMIQNTDWFLVENQIEEELLIQNNKKNIIQKVTDIILSIYYENRQIQIIRDVEVEDIYVLISYCLLYKNLNTLHLDSSRKLYSDFRELVTELRKKQSEINYDNVYDRDILTHSFEREINFKLTPMISQILLTELKELETDFSNYLNEAIETRERQYCVSAKELTEKILRVSDDTIYSFAERINYKFNILSFNYTQPWSFGGFSLGIFSNLISTQNIHGVIDGKFSHIIFGIDDETIKPSANEYIFTKASRTLDLYTNTQSTSSLDHKDLNSILPLTIKRLVFYGHSLSKADYSYFRIILDRYVEEDDVIFTFVYSVYEGTSTEAERRKIVQNISALFGDYSVGKNSNTDIFKRLVQNNRIKIEEL